MSYFAMDYFLQSNADWITDFVAVFHKMQTKGENGLTQITKLGRWEGSEPTATKEFFENSRKGKKKNILSENQGFWDGYT